MQHPCDAAGMSDLSSERSRSPLSELSGDRDIRRIQLVMSVECETVLLAWFTARMQRFESVVQHDAQERSIDLNAAVVLDETQLPEFVHKQIDPSTRCADHLR